ncbi:MAG: UvrD-helicase domain-containing protein [Acidaminococcales bacterium]|nr:UvrD-helicase domain-containing protein [Acidaminococcales bacterium]
MGKYLEGLNAEQQKAVFMTEGAVRVIAGAGTGKTRTLTARFCYIVSALGIAPENVFCVTFTNRAANEMKRRVRFALGDMDLGFISTFHSFCVRLLKEDAHALNYPKNFVILDVEDQKEMLLKIFADMKLTLRDATVRRTIDNVLEAKKLCASTYIDDIYELDNERLKAKFARAKDREEEIFLRYLYEQKKCFGCDFNDLINFAAYILERFPAVRSKWQDRMQYVMVDEFQDVSEKQYKIARVLSEKHGNLFIVGDPDQTIYSWRGSHVKMFLDFDKLYPAARTFTLAVNYRSTPEILKAADTLIEKNAIRFPKKLITSKDSGKRPLYYHAAGVREEAAWIYGQIRELAAAGASLGEVAVLYRAHYQTRALEECFIQKGLPYKIFSGVEFYGRREIKDIICYLRMVTIGDDAAFLRTIGAPPRKIGKRKMGFLKEYAEQRDISLYDALKENLSGDLLRGTQAARYAEAIELVREKRGGMAMGDALQMLLDLSGYEEFLRLQGDQERLDNVAELKRAVESADKDEDAILEDFLAQAALFTNLDRGGASETVKLMTVHAAKGMEFAHVFVCGLNEGVFPSRLTDTPEGMDEERRLAYVAMTRAGERLFLSSSEGAAGDGIFKYPSRFIFDAGKENLDYVAALDAALEESAKKHIEYSAELLKSRERSFGLGDQVVHPVFGIGEITGVNLAGSYYRVCFAGLKTERNVQFAADLKEYGGEKTGDGQKAPPPQK